MIVSYSKATALGSEDDSIQKWISLPVSLLVVILLVVCEIMEFKTKIINKSVPKKNSSVDASDNLKKRRLPPSQKESKIEIKNPEKIALTSEKDEKADGRSLKLVRILYILRNDMDELALPDQPLKRYSSHFSYGKF